MLMPRSCIRFDRGWETFLQSPVVMSFDFTITKRSLVRWKNPGGILCFGFEAVEPGILVCAVGTCGLELFHKGFADFHAERR